MVLLSFATVAAKSRDSPERGTKPASAAGGALFAPDSLAIPLLLVRSAGAGLGAGAAAEGTVYAKDLSRPMVFTVEKALADELKKSPDDFRIKDLFDARSFNTTRLDITLKGQTLAFQKEKEAWKQVAPANKAVDNAKMDALLTALTGARATTFADKATATGLDSPELTVAVKYEDGQKQEKVSFARKGTDVFARREGDASAAKIDASLLDAIEKALGAVK